MDAAIIYRLAAIFRPAPVYIIGSDAWNSWDTFTAAEVTAAAWKRVAPSSSTSSGSIPWVTSTINPRHHQTHHHPRELRGRRPLSIRHPRDPRAKSWAALETAAIGTPSPKPAKPNKTPKSKAEPQATPPEPTKQTKTKGKIKPLPTSTEWTPETAAAPKPATKKKAS